MTIVTFGMEYNFAIIFLKFVKQVFFSRQKQGWLFVSAGWLNSGG